MRARDTLRGLPPTKPPTAAADAPAPDPLSAYLVDAAQRTILYWDVMRRRGNQYLEHMAQKVPNVLHFGAELVMAGTSLERPVNYGLVRIVPPQGVTVDPKKRPFVVIDPRAGHGPGIGGVKPESQIGVALAAGHPCYFIGFLPQPVPGQTIEDVMEAEAAFLAKVVSLHPQADGRPVVIGNCQGGWATMMLAAAHPDLVGPVIVAGAPGAAPAWTSIEQSARRLGIDVRYTGDLLTIDDGQLQVSVLGTRDESQAAAVVVRRRAMSVVIALTSGRIPAAGQMLVTANPNDAPHTDLIVTTDDTAGRQTQQLEVVVERGDTVRVELEPASIQVFGGTRRMGND